MANENSIFSNPLFIIALFVILIVIIILIIKKSKNREKYKFRELHKTIHEDLKEKFGLMGIKYKKFKPGLLFANNHEIAKIKKFFTIKGNIGILIYDEDKQKTEYNAEDKSQIYQFFMIQARNKNWILGLIGLKDRYFCLVTGVEDKSFLHYDPYNRIWMLPQDTDMRYYGKVWINHNAAEEYVQDISIKRMLERMQMYAENIPDFWAHTAQEQSSKERSDRILVAHDKTLREAAKSSGDQTIE